MQRDWLLRIKPQPVGTEPRPLGPLPLGGLTRRRKLWINLRYHRILGPWNGFTYRVR